MRLRLPALLSAAVLAALAAFAAPQPAAAQTNNETARVVVPDNPNGALVAGCYRADRNLYGPYRLTFCLKRSGTYQAVGGGLTCNSRLTWTVEGKRRVEVDLRRGTCNRNKAWAAATMSCRALTREQELLLSLLGDREKLGGLRCTYTPSVQGEPVRSFFAIRQKT